MKSHTYYNNVIVKLMHGLFACLLLQSCNSESVVFCGNPGVGKSTLANSAIGKAAFKSGLSDYTGLTAEKQVVSHEGRLYIDTPGLNDVDPEKNKIYAKEIEKALKSNPNSKIIFVAKLDSARVRMADFATIRVVCDAIDINPLEYGIIFNQISDKVIKKFGPTKEALQEKVLNKIIKSEKLGKKPSSVLILEENSDLHDEDNVFLPAGDEKNRLLSFITNLKANNIQESQVKPIDVRDLKEIEKALKEEYDKKLKDIEDDCNCCIQ